MTHRSCGSTLRKVPKEMDAILSAWILPAYLPMLVVIAATVKLLVVPAFKSLWFGNMDTHPKGYTSVLAVVISSIVIALLYKFIKHIGAWDAEGIIMTILVGLAAAFTAIGANVTTQAIKGQDVSIGKQ